MASSKSQQYLALRGNTYPVRVALAKLGAYWDPAAKAWMVPEDKFERASRLVHGDHVKHAEKFESFRPTGEQAGLLAFLQAGRRNLFIEAGAGCGKTTTALWLLSMLGGGLRKCMVAFNRDIKLDIEKKASVDTEVLTMNSLGFRALLGAYRVKYDDIEVDDLHTMTMLREHHGVEAVRAFPEFYAETAYLYELARGALATSAEELDILASSPSFDLSFEVETERGTEDWRPKAFEVVLSMMRDRMGHKGCPKVIDYVDQMWLPVVRNLPLPQYDVLVIDEAQDTNALQLEMLSRVVAATGRAIAVGDRRQAIYQFRGADSRAVDAIVERFDAGVMPLMTTFRCAKKIVEEAQRIVPEFMAGPNNPDGVVRHVSEARYLSEVLPGDFVISRTNAPLVEGCITLLGRGVPARVVGRDVGGSLKALAKRVGGKTLGDMGRRLDAWLAKEIAKIEARFPVREEMIAAARDRYACLQAIIAGVDEVSEVTSRIDGLFSDTSSTGVVEFTTVHKAKGRERDRVFLLRDTFCRSRRNRSGEWCEPGIEEFNLLYVGITRAKTELVYVVGNKKGRG